MRHARLLSLLTLAAAALGGCESLNRSRPQPTVQIEPDTPADAWQRVANQEDVSRINRLSEAWAVALGEARSAGFRSEIASAGDLLKPSAALPRPAVTPGSYQCRLVRLGRYSSKTRAFEQFKPFFCYVEVEGELLTIVKQTGSQRPAGRLWEDDRDNRLIFLGSLALGNEEQPLAYGENSARDMAGVLERIAPFRWRLVIPWPRGQSKLDVFELTPVAEQPAAS